MCWPSSSSRAAPWSSTAQSAAEAIAICAKLRPDLLISDIGLPGEDGFSLLRRLRELPSALGGDVPAIALTGYDSEADSAPANGASFSERLTKPVSLEAVLEAVTRVLASPSP